MKKRSMKRIISLLFAVLLVLSAVPGLALSARADNRTVRVGFFAYPGYHELSNGVRSGYGYDFLLLLQRYTNLNFEFIGYDLSWEDMQEMLRDGEIDLVTSARKTPERELQFAFSEPIGTNKALINVRADDERFNPGDYAALNGVKIGILKGNSRNGDLAAFADEKIFSYTPVEYDTAEELDTALHSGEVDAAASSSLRKFSREKTVAEFAPQDFYVMVRKADAELLSEINYGISQMDLYEGNWRDDIYFANYKTDFSEELSFTRRELEYIRAVQSGEKSITVSAQPDRDPYSYVLNGQLTGIIPDYFAHLMQMAGLEYTTLVAKDLNEFQTWTMTNYTDVIMDCRYGTAPNTQFDFGLVTVPYMTLTTSRVTRKGFSGDIRLVATCDAKSEKYIDDGFTDNAGYLLVDTREDAMRAVSDGKADACYVYTYMADKFINADPNSNLQSVMLKEPVYNEYIYVSPDSDHELCSILNKCIKADSSGALDSYVRQYTTVTIDNLSFTQYLKLHPILILLGGAALAVLMALILIAVARARNARTKTERLERELEQQRMLEESLTFTNYFLGTYISAYYVNLDSLQCQVYKRTEQLDRDFPIIGSYLDSITDYIYRNVHPEDRAELEALVQPENMRKILQKNEEYAHIFRDISSGEERQYRMQIIRGADERHAAFGFLDITEELQEQRRLILGAVPLSTDVLNKANIGLWAFELDEGKPPRMYGDEAMLRLVGLEHQVPPEDMYHAWYDRIDPDSYGIVTDAVTRMTLGEHAEVQYPWIHPDGHTMIVRCGGVRNSEYKRGIRIEGTHQDVSETIHFQAEGAKRDRDIIEILASEYSSVYYIDLETDGLTPYTMNETTESAFGKIFRSGIFYSEAFRLYVDEQVLPEDREMMLRAGAVSNIAEELRGKKTFITTYRDANGRFSEMKFVKVGSESDEPSAVALGFADRDAQIRGEMEHQRQLKEARDAAEAANQSKTNFLFNMSHDIRTPMNAIIGFTKLAKKHIDDRERALDSLNKIESSGNHLLNLINEVLDMSRVEAGKLRSEIKTVNVSEAAQRLVTICRESAEQRNIHLSYEEKNVIHKLVEADELHINQIIMNILGNAIKYTEPGGSVRYTVEEVESAVPGYGRYILTVEDTGIGMSPEFLKHIYESFSREDKATTAKIQGTGLGMSIVKRLVDFMDGQIDIQSEQGSGTKVTVALHLMLADGAGTAEQAREETVLDLTGKRALLVEDNDLNREIAVDILEESGVTVEEAVNGIDAVEHIKNRGAAYYDFVLMDIQMPLMDGYEATARIRKLPGADRLPIIALSANAFEEDRQKSIESGMNDHVAKPIVLEDLMEALAKIL